MDRAEYEAQLNHTGELYDVEPPEDELQQALRKYHDGQPLLRQAVRQTNEHTRTFLRSMGWPTEAA
jgi:hypothetical protein